MPTILLIRHGQGSFGTADYDVLSALGVAQSSDTYAHYGSRSGGDSAVLTAGTLRRQRETAAPWLTGAAELRLDEGWNEYDTDHILDAYAGQQVSLDVADGQEQLPPKVFQEILDSSLARWIADPGADAQSWAAFRQSALDALHDLRRSVGSGQTGVAFTSGGVIAVCVAAVLGLPDVAFVPFNRAAVNTGVTKILAGRSGLTLMSYNAHEHLPAERVTFR